MASVRRQFPVSVFNPARCLRPQAWGDDLFRDWDRPSLPSSSLPSFEPGSPRVGCMGQIKDAKSSSSSSSSSLFFTRRKLKILRKALMGKNVRVSQVVCVSVLDPPLPVARGCTASGARAASLWERRRCDQVLPLDVVDLPQKKQRPPPVYLVVS